MPFFRHARPQTPHTEPEPVEEQTAKPIVVGRRFTAQERHERLMQMQSRVQTWYDYYRPYSSSSPSRVRLA
eukprot:m.332035 g.332035  ORF g.332035 m.332035 type:complete len:71 (+) comp16860_c0_seq1:134-346(+)